ncbi:GOLPH3/VPS74 family protein [Streptacidiphilus cavernicola]|uniref:GPP34 family phosphoprotein n=1 Tax=Streptacidiphilus cavernicola TaxID=3342716 RepID=A0ABV6W511_9ACTN
MDRRPGPPASTLAEDLLLLCASPDAPRLRLPGHFRFVVSGGVLAELLEAGAATLHGNRLVLVSPDAAPATLSHAAAAFSRSAAPPRGARLRRCLTLLGRQVATPYLESLVRREHLQRGTRKLLGLVPTTRYTATPAGLAARKALVARIADAVDSPAAAPPRSLRLAALAHAGGLTARLYPGPVANRVARRRLADLTRDDPVATAVRAAVRAARNAESGAAG